MFDFTVTLVECNVYVQVIGQYARTMFSISMEAEQLTATKEKAADVLKKVHKYTVTYFSLHFCIKLGLYDCMAV